MWWLCVSEFIKETIGGIREEQLVLCIISLSGKVIISGQRRIAI